MQKAIKVVAYNPTTEEELHFSSKAQCAKYFGLKANTVISLTLYFSICISLISIQLIVSKKVHTVKHKLFLIILFLPSVQNHQLVLV